MVILSFHYLACVRVSVDKGTKVSVCPFQGNISVLGTVFFSPDFTIVDSL